MERQQREVHRVIVFFFTLLLAHSPIVQANPCLYRQAAQTDGKDVRTLELNVPIERDLAGGQVHSYSIKMAAGQFFGLIVEQRGIDVVASLFAPDGKQLSEVDSPNGTQGPEPVSLVAKVAGSYRLEVRSLEKEAAAGRYEVKIQVLRDATLRDKTGYLAWNLVAAKTEGERAALLTEHKELMTKELALALNDQGRRFRSRGDYAAALTSHQVAQRIAEQTGDQTELGYALNNIGNVFQIQEDFPRAQQFYEKGLPISEALGDKMLLFVSFNNLGSAHYFQGRYAQASEFYAKALALIEKTDKNAQMAAVLNNLGNLSKDQGNYPQALEYYRRSLVLNEELNDTPNIGGTQNNIGMVYQALNDYAQALEYLQKGLKVREALRDNVLIAFSLNNIGNLYEAQGSYGQAVDAFQRGLTLLEAIGHHGGVATLLVNIASIQTRQGNYAQALESFQKSLKVMEALGNKPAAARVIMGIGRIHAQQGDPAQALTYYHKALPILEESGRKGEVTNLLTEIGGVYSDSGNYALALDYLRRALALGEAMGNKVQVAASLVSIGNVYNHQKDYDRALSDYQKALAVYESLGNKSGIATILNDMAVVFDEQGKHQQQLELADRSAALVQQTGERELLLVSRTMAGKAHQALNQPAQARKAFEDAIAVVESLRINVAGQEARATYFAKVRQPYEAYIDFLMELHKQQPSEGNDTVALQINERARARSLLEALSEARADIRQGVDPALLESERTLQQRLNATAARQTALLSGKHSEAQASLIRKELDALAGEYQQIQTQIRQRNPRYAALTQPAPLNLAEIQSQVLDADTLLLEYALGDERSYVWAVTQTSIKSYELPKRGEIEKSVRRVYELLSDGKQWVESERINAQYAEASARLSQMLLAPVATQLQKKRLVIVGDGALQYLPFGALPVPAAMRTGKQSPNRPPLIVEHEIVSLPSASTLAVLRRETANRARATKSIAVLADPVFMEDDERVKQALAANQGSGEKAAEDASSSANAQASTVSQSSISRSLLLRALDFQSNNSADDTARSGALRIRRLPFTRREADGILASAPEAAGMKALDFRASRETATSSDLAQYRIIHFATHGFLNSEHPELSGIVLSLFNEAGQPVDGFLRLHEIYNLNLSADMVVLSACQTALGKEIKGEGLVGLTRGFMYAGSSRVVASLWKVDDAATAELMKRFYEGMLLKQMRPADALRAAKVEMWKQKRWQAPYFWAAFELQGEWK